MLWFVADCGGVWFIVIGLFGLLVLFSVCLVCCVLCCYVGLVS